jgi:SecD/SecF fusion protein
VAAVELVDRGIWVTPRDSSVRAELQPALIEAMGDAYEVRGTSAKSLLVRRTRRNRKLAVRALKRETTVAVRQRLAAVAPGCKVTIKRNLSIQLKRPDQARDVRQLLGQRGDLSMHLVEPGSAALAAMTRFQHRVAGKWVLQRQPALTTDLIDGARLQRGQKSGTTNLTLDLTPAGKERLAEVAAAYGGRKLAVVLDGKVLTAPLLKDPPDDPTAITGKLRGRPSEARLERLSRVLESALLHGPLPARLKEIR